MALVQEHVLFYGWCVTHGHTSYTCIQLAAHTQPVVGWDICVQYSSLLGLVGFVFLEVPSILFSNHVFQPHLTQILMQAPGRLDGFVWFTSPELCGSFSSSLAYWHWGTGELKNAAYVHPLPPPVVCLISAFLQWPISDGNAEDLGRQSKVENHITLRFSSFSGPPWAVEQYHFMAAAAGFWSYMG